MSFITEFMDYMVERVADRSIISLEIKPYQFSINGEDLPYEKTSTLEVDSDGDVILNFEIDKDILIENLIDEEDMIKYLENKGYKVVEEED